jgi:hypothetical protein
MVRYGKTTTLSPGQVLQLARAHFGPEGELGLPLTREAPNEVVFEGGGGGVAVTALLRAGTLATTDVEIVSREYDYWAERFLPQLPTA